MNTWIRIKEKEEEKERFINLEKVEEIVIIEDEIEFRYPAYGGSMTFRGYFRKGSKSSRSDQVDEASIMPEELFRELKEMIFEILSK